MTTRAIATTPRVNAIAMRDRVVQILTSSRAMLDRATTAQQAKLITDVAAAQKVYAMRQQLGADVIGRAHALKIDALARLGDLLKVTPKATGGTHGGRRRKLGTRREPSFIAPPTLAELGIGKKEAATAQQLAAMPPAVRDAIAQQEITITEAKRQQRRATQPQTRAIPDGRFRVLYADPPWSYGNSGAIGDDAYGRAARHYPSMSIADLCALDVRARVADDAVLFLWVTSPLLAECWPVIAAWGFAYKTSIVWDKVRHNYGSYVSVRHEFLLICTRGSCLPDQPTPMPDSVIVAERSQHHSEKPAVFRELVDRLYTGGADQKLELFARHAVDGWTAFGNETL
jgi:N6-adenosine-specific RNA methylase IME4